MRSLRLRSVFVAAALLVLGATGVARADVNLTITSNPPGADVFVDDPSQGSWGTTPLTIPIPPGPHRLIVRLAGQPDQVKQINLHSEAHFAFDFTQPAARPAPAPYPVYTPPPAYAAGPAAPAETIVRAPPEPMPAYRWFGELGVGVGVGHPSAKTEVTSANTPAVSYTPFDFQPEIGTWVSPRLALGAAARLQLSSGADLQGSAVGAWAALARLRYWGYKSSRLNAFVLGDLGAGYFRQPVTLPVQAGAGGNIDDAKSGPFLFGAGAEVTWDLTPTLALAGSANLLIGVGSYTMSPQFQGGSSTTSPTAGENVDFHVGAVARF